MKSIEIFDPGMCCSTGVCGPAIDPELMRMATIVNSLARKGIHIKRHNLSNEPQDFVANKAIGALLAKEGAEVLPITLLDGEIAKTHQYPTNEELSSWLGMRIGARSTPIMRSDCNCSDGNCN